MAELRKTSEDRQAELIDAALHIIATRGIAALSTRCLAEHVGLSTGAIFRHFPSLDTLLEAVVERMEAVLDATYPPPELPPGARLARFIDARSTAIGQQLGILRLVQSEQVLLALPPRASARLTNAVRRSREFVVACLREGQATGDVRDDLDPSALAVIAMGTMQMLALSTAHPRRGTPDSRAVRDSLLALLRPPASGNKRAP
jgi:TetR/AcrR family transcriptional regulator